MTDDERCYLETLLRSVEDKLYMGRSQTELIAVPKDKLYLIQDMIRERLGWECGTTEI